MCGCHEIEELVKKYTQIEREKHFYSNCILNFHQDNKFSVEIYSPHMHNVILTNAIAYHL